MHFVFHKLISFSSVVELEVENYLKFSPLHFHLHLASSNSTSQRPLPFKGLMFTHRMCESQTGFFSNFHPGMSFERGLDGVSRVVIVECFVFLLLLLF